MQYATSSAMLAPMGEIDTIAAVLVVVGYLVGSIPLANSVARRRGAPDLRDVGDQNPGFWNSRSVLTSRDSTVVFIGDLAKGAVPASLALALTTNWVVAYLAGLAAMIGHAWPLFAGFRGGRSVLTWVGATLVVAPLPAALAVVLLAVVWIVTRKFPLAVKVAVIAFPFIQFVIEDPWRTAMSGVLMTFVGLRFLTAARKN
jgi:acyl phosphate:glycerol-3-phosphate acyltransferase